MVGSGAVVFAVWGYVIAKMEPDRVVGAQVSLNAKLLEAIIGEPEAEITKAIAFLCSPDESSRTKAEDGRRLVRLGEFDYQVVNGAKYRAIRDDEKRREQNREAQARFREKRKKVRAVGSGGARERQYVRDFGDGKITADGVPIEQPKPAGPSSKEVVGSRLKTFKEVLPGPAAGGGGGSQQLGVNVGGAGGD